MVIFTDWLLYPVNLRSTCGLPMTGEDTGLEAVASPMAGYLGKVQERAASLDHCPWCSAKGLTSPLRSYQINFEESITLCINPQCLFPLVSRPLEDVLASLVHVEPTPGKKRKNSPTLVADEPSKPSPKRLRFNELYRTDTSIDDNLHVICSNGQPIEAHGENGNINIDSPETNQLERLQQKDTILEKNSDAAVACTDGFTAPFTSDTADHIQRSSKILTITDNPQVLSSPNNRLNGEDSCNSNTEALERDCSLQEVDVFSNENNTLFPGHNGALGTTEPITQSEDSSICPEIKAIQSETEELSKAETYSEELVSAPSEIFWRNRDNLCWLDSLLVALVNLRSLRKLKPKDEPEQSPVWTLLRDYEEAWAEIQARQQTDRDGSLKVPTRMLDKINKDLETLRMSVFSPLQLKLHCKLGQKETPVFALPLLVKMDSWLEPLFQSIFHWDFRCSECKSTTKETVVKTLPTFTNIVPDWHPLRAVHLAPCNVCHRKNQRRRMVLEGVPPVFALHFVEGLPDNNIQVYSFNFKKKHYSVTAIIQYSSHLKHFVTWVQKSDGSWVEFDDLKHPHCKTYKTLPVPAQEIHVVFWEEDEERQESRACSPSTTFTESPPSTNEISHHVTNLDIIAEDLLKCAPDLSLLNPQNDTGDISEQDITVTDTSIGSTTLLDAFEGLTHNDIVKLTLVEIKEDSKRHPSNTNDGQSDETQDLKCPDLNNVIQDSLQDICTPAPDSSSTVGAIETPKETDSELFAVSEPEDDDLDDPTFKPKTRKAQKRGIGAASKTAKKQKPNNAKSIITSKVNKNASQSAVQSDPTPAAASKLFSSVSSTVSAPQNVAQPPPVVQQVQQKGWSHLLQRSLGHIQNASSKISPTPSAQEPVGPVHSTPKPPRRPVLTKIPPKPLLRKEDNGGLPLKAAEMYGAFGLRNSNYSTVNLNIKPLESPVEIPKTPSTLANNSLNISVAGLQTEITFSKKTKSSKVPPGLSETETLRYKLMKKLKAKKKKLAKLNEMLGQQVDGSFRPDSTNINSPNTVTSSTLDSSTCDEFFSELLSPATTITSTLSPDSTGFLEMFASGQVVPVGEEMQTAVQGSTAAETENFLDEFMSQAVAEQPTEMEAEALSALDLFL